MHFRIFSSGFLLLLDMMCCRWMCGILWIHFCFRLGLVLGVVMFVFPVLFFCAVYLLTNRLHHAEWHNGVKWFLFFETCLNFNEWCLRYSAKNSKCIRNVSRKYETAGTGGVFAGEDFRNREVFIVLTSTVFAKSSGHKTHLARDA